MQAGSSAGKMFVLSEPGDLVGRLEWKMNQDSILDSVLQTLCGEICHLLQHSQLQNEVPQVLNRWLHLRMAPSPLQTGKELKED